jgi:hypothetical protein
LSFTRSSIRSFAPLGFRLDVPDAPYFVFGSAELAQPLPRVVRAHFEVDYHPGVVLADGLQEEAVGGDRLRRLGGPLNTCRLPG